MTSKDVDKENSANNVKADASNSVNTENNETVEDIAKDLNDLGVPTAQLVTISKKDRIANNVFIIAILPIIFLLLTLVFSIPMAVQTIQSGEINIALALAVTVIAEVATIFAYILYTKNKIPINWKNKLGFQNFSWKWMVISIVIGIALFALLQLSQIALTEIFNVDVSSSETSASVFEAEGITKYLALFFLVPIVAPLVEEILFRGVIFNGLLLGKMPVAWSFFIGAFAFAIMHVQGFSSFTDIFTVVWIFFMALVMGIVFYKTRSVYNTIALHLAYNSTTVIVSLLLISIGA